MQFSDLTKERHSSRSFDPERAVDQGLLEHLLESASHAPSAVNLQPWKILVIKNQPGLDRIHAAYPRDWFMNAPIVVAVSGFRRDAWTRPSDGYNSLETDLAIYLYHFVLAAADVGLATCWISNFEPDVLAQALELAQDQEVFGLTPLGYAKTNQKATLQERKPWRTTVRWI